MSKRRTKPVSFGDSDSDIEKWIEDNKIKFSTYVKDLIREDMKKNVPGIQVDKEDLKQTIISILEELNIKKEESITQVENSLNEKQKSAINRYIKK